MKNFYKKQQETATLFNQSMPQNAKNDTSLGKKSCKNTKNSVSLISFLRSNRLFKGITAGSLAILMGAGVLCGVLLAPINSAQVNIKNKENHLTLQEQLLTGSSLGLDPKNDPVVYTTDWGLEIKFHQAIGEFDELSSGALNGFSYFSMGKYNDVDINWVIIGKNPNLSKSANVYNQFYSHWATYGYSFFNDGTPAASAIHQDNKVEKTRIFDYLNGFFYNAEPDPDIMAGCVLCLSEKIILDAVFSSSSIQYENSNLQSVMWDLYSSDLHFTESQQEQIQFQTLRSNYYSVYGQNPNYTTSVDQKLFPLASKEDAPDTHPQAFCVETYFPNSSQRIASKINSDKACRWLTRTGCSTVYGSIHFLETNGNMVHYDGYHASPLGVRPAFVLKI